MAESLIKSADTKREWLVRCADNRENLAVCAVSVADGRIEIFGPQDEEVIVLSGAQIADFRVAFDTAVVQAENDLRAHRSVQSAV